MDAGAAGLGCSEDKCRCLSEAEALDPVLVKPRCSCGGLSPFDDCVAVDGDGGLDRSCALLAPGLGGFCHLGVILVAGDLVICCTLALGDIVDLGHRGQRRGRLLVSGLAALVPGNVHEELVAVATLCLAAGAADVVVDVGTRAAAGAAGAAGAGLPATRAHLARLASLRLKLDLPVGKTSRTLPVHNECNEGATDVGSCNPVLHWTRECGAARWWRLWWLWWQGGGMVTAGQWGKKE